MEVISFLLNLLSFAFFPILALVFYFFDKNRIPKWSKNVIVFLSLLFICVQFYSSFIGEKADNDFKSRSMYKLNDNSMKIDQVGNKVDIKNNQQAKSVTDYLFEIVKELQNIRFKIDRSKSRSEYVTNYFKRVDNIPQYYNESEWLETEILIYKDCFNSVQGAFSERGLINSSGTKLYVETLKKERDKLLRAKKRVFKK